MLNFIFLLIYFNKIELSSFSHEFLIFLHIPFQNFVQRPDQPLKALTIQSNCFHISLDFRMFSDVSKRTKINKFSYKSIKKSFFLPWP